MVELNEKLHLAAIDYFLIFAAFFVGDHLLLGYIPSFIIVWISILIWRFLNGPYYSVGELLAQLGVFALCLPLYIRGLVSYEFYYFFLFQAVLFVNALPLIIRVLQSRLLGAVALFSCVIFLLEGVYTWNQRQGILFGPNVLYRVYALPLSMLAASCLISRSSNINFKTPGWLAGLAAALLLVPIISTGSRGGLMTYALVVFVLGAIYMRKEKKSHYASLLIASLSIAALLFYNWSTLQISLGRTVDYRSVIEGDAIRFSLFSRGYDFMSYENGVDLVFGLGSVNSYYADGVLYPHNFFLELLVYHGAFFLVIVLLQYVLVFMYTHKAGAFCISGLVLMLPIFVGAMVSGNLQDHAYLLGFPFSWAAVCNGYEEDILGRKIL